MEKTLVFGASLKANRYSNMAMRRLEEKGVETIGFGLVKGQVGEIEVTNNLDAIKDIHTVTLYMNPKRQRDYYEYLIGLHPKRVIFNPGTENPELQQRLQARGIETLQACTLVMLATGRY